MDLMARMAAMDLRMVADRTGREHNRALGTGTPADPSGEQRRQGEDATPSIDTAAEENGGGDPLPPRPKSPTEGAGPQTTADGATPETNGEYTLSDNSTEQLVTPFPKGTRFVADIPTQNRFQLIDFDGELAASRVFKKIASAMRVEVEGEEIMPEEVSKKFGWRVAGEKKTQVQESKLSLTPVNAGPAAAGHRRPQRKKIQEKATQGSEDACVAEARYQDRHASQGWPEHWRTIVVAANVSGEEVTQDVICPNKQQNIVVVITHKRENADRYSAVRSLTINGMAHEVSAYVTAPHGTVKGVKRGVLFTDTVQETNDYTVQGYNPTAMEANRIGKTTTVVIAFDGDKVQNYIKYGNLLIECSLYRKQIDMCCRCGRLGHRMDVCPNSENRICRGCGIKNPKKSHVCSNPKCSLCGGNHLSADKRRGAAAAAAAEGASVAADNVTGVRGASQPLQDKAREKQERCQVIIGGWGSQARISFEVQVEDPAEQRRREREEKAEAAVPPTMETVMSMLTQISNQVSQLSEQVNSLTVRMNNVEAKHRQLSVRVMTCDAKIKHLTVAKMKSSRVNLRVRPQEVGSVHNPTAQKVEN
ncbi:hypothetical protein HPB47_018828 [Ixodes persulcatus]|uniref:Uncharacterized protein n=1 Tax=Ixodes persulcatus TaxID=34615 RepID=A0AC60QNA6_IXOPE|nr:hypothetical protein HPB47_018828 [Ixodes persulcatus]